MSSNNLIKKEEASLAFVQVALPVPLHRLFEYSVQSSERHNYHIGCRVLVPFGKKEVVGVVIKTSASTDYSLDKIKAVSKLLDTQAVFSSHAITLANWIAKFYIYPLGEVLSTMLPALLRKSSTKLNSAELPLIDYLHPNTANEQQLNALKKSKKQLALFQQLHTQSMKVKQAKTDFSPAIVKGLIDKSLARIEQTKPKQGRWVNYIALGEKKRANPEQAIAIASINQSTEFSAFLLEGVTGSGKTEVYLQVIEEIILQGKQVLILVPEIGLTPQTVRRFEQRFGDIVALWHSGLSDHDRLQVWLQAKFDQVGIVIGTRSAVFLPFANLGMLIVDEEHDESFKQQDTLRYHARDVAAYRAKQASINLILGTATPSLESLHNGLSKKYHHLTLTQRAGNANMPTQHLIDMTGIELEAGIAPSMLVRIEQQLSQGNQVLVYVNRRGYAPALICAQCGHVETCIDCDNPFTLHLTSHNLQCHRCGQYEDYVYKCRQCQSPNITTQGLGTEQIQNMLAKRFKDYSCVRIDSDSTRGKGKLNELLTEIGENKHQLLVGTQILSKGHHFPNVTLAIILNVDSFLFSSDFRASEKLAQLITQFSGRAGRANKPGEVWLQSYQVGHPLLQDLVNNGYGQFSRLLLQERNSANLPPLQWQVAIRVEHTDRTLVVSFLQYANQLLSQFSKLTYVGPFPAGIEKKQTRFRFITVAQSPSNKYLNEAMTQVKEALVKHRLAGRMRWSIDVMPTDFS